MRRVKLTFRCFLSEINILAITRAHEINILTFFDLKLTFFIFHVA